LFSEIFILFISREIQKLRRKVRNKARVEGCIVEAELVEEATNNLSIFLDPKLDQLGTRFLDMMMLPLPSKVLATWKSFNILGVA